MPPKGGTKKSGKAVVKGVSKTKKSVEKKSPSKLSQVLIEETTNDEQGDLHQLGCEGGKDCCICLETPEESELSSINCCSHLFCFICIEGWSEQENTCPLW